VIPYRGHIPPPPGVSTTPAMAVAGPLGRSAGDLILAMEALTTPAPGETPTTDTVELSPPQPRALNDYRIAVWLDDAGATVDTALMPPLQQTVAALREAGARIDETARPAISLAQIHEIYHDLVRRVLRGYGPADLEQRQRELQDTFARFFADHDVLLAPVARVAAFPHDHSQPMGDRRLPVNGADTDYIHSLDIWVSLASAAHLPATTTPVGFTAAGLPVGMQIIGPFRDDWSTLDFARQLARLTGGFAAPPGYG